MPNSEMSRLQEDLRREDRKALAITFSVIAGIILIFAGFFYFVYVRASEAHARFMRQCMEDHKEYECTALWRAGDSALPNVVLMPVPVGR